MWSLLFLSPLLGSADTEAVMSPFYPNLAPEKPGFMQPVLMLSPLVGIPENIEVMSPILLNSSPFGRQGLCSHL